MASGSEFDSQYGQEISLLEIIQTIPETNPVSFPMDGWGIPLGVKRPGREADHPPQTGAEVKKTWNYKPTPPYVFMA
jgi:hypothetical protein